MTGHVTEGAVIPFPISRRNAHVEAALMHNEDARRGLDRLIGMISRLEIDAAEVRELTEVAANVLGRILMTKSEIEKSRE